jgi:hypothetical protein
MRDNARRTRGADDKANAPSTAQTRSGDAKSQRLANAGKALGNAEMLQRVQKGNTNRDEMLSFVSDRLKLVREVQLREVGALSKPSQDQWKYAIADNHKEDITKPDPKRWHAASQLYEDAIHKLSRGEMTLGRQLVEQAIDAERKAFDRLTHIVNVDDIESIEDLPAALRDASMEGAQPRDPPTEDLRLANDIQNTDDQMKDPPVRMTKRPWWEEEEEEDEENADKKPEDQKS